MWHQHFGSKPHHRFDGRVLSFLLVLVLTLGSFAYAEEDTVLKGVYNPDVPPPTVVEHEPAPDEYFADAVFLGDSSMEFVEVLGRLPEANFVYKVGMSVASVDRRQFRVRGQEENVTAFDLMAEYSPKKIYVMLGSNGLDNYSYKNIIADYEELADALVTHFPEAMIYVIAVPPMTEELMIERNNYAGRYSLFAQELEALAGRRNFYFLDFYSLVVGEDGFLPQKYDSGDGLHLTSTAYSILVDLVLRTTVEYPTQEE